MAAKRNDETDGEAVELGSAAVDGVYRMSVTLDHSQRKNIRIAAALADLTPGEWACAVLERAAVKATQGT